MSVLTLALVFLIAAAVIAVIAERVRLPYTIALVLAGFLAGSLHVFPRVTVSSDVLLTLLIPPLLFEGSLSLSPTDLRTYGGLIALLAIPGTLLAAVVIGGVAGVLFPLSGRTALTLGAIASAIDPVSVIALIREARIDRHLGTILETEAVWNDGVAIVLVTIVAGSARVGILAAAGQFVWLLGAGALVGAVLAYAVCYGLAPTRQPLVQALGSLIVAVGSLVAATSVGASGVVAVMIAGLVFGSTGLRHLTEAGRETVRTLWAVIAFLANTMLFLLIGLQVPGGLLLHHGGLIAVVIVTALVVRAVSVYGACALYERVVPIARGWRAVLSWGGVRGGVAVALVLGLAAQTPGREAVEAAVFGLVLFTLLGQGLCRCPR